MSLERPDLSQVPPEIRAYIESLEEQLRQSSTTAKRSSAEKHSTERDGSLPEGEPLEPIEPVTSLNLITVSRAGSAKRTPRHLYARQRRGGMGIFDLETTGEDYPDVLAVADENQGLLVFTNLARVFRLPVSKLEEAPVRERGEDLSDRLDLEPGEHIAAILPDQAAGFVALVSQIGMVRVLRHHLFGDYLKPGTALYNPKEHGELAAACWTAGDSDLFIATRGGTAIRFSEKLIPPKGDLGIRVSDNNPVVAITPVYPDSGVFLVGADGKGTIRLMSGFAPNKSAGGGGKLAMKSDLVVGAAAVDAQADDVFLISHLGKIIRFRLDEVPESEAVVQGVNCMALRSDHVTALVRSLPAPTKLHR